MKEKRDIQSYFDGLLENISIILENKFYKDEDKSNLNNVRNKVENWYKFYKKNNKLIGISPEDLIYLDLEITDLFDKYIETEPIKENYAERLLYDFGHLESLWKEEMIGGKKENNHG